MLTKLKLEPAADPVEMPRRILIVEESDINRRLAQHVFVQAGYLAETVSNGHDAVRAVKEHRYDLIVMDCRLSDFPQFMATRMIRLQENRHPQGWRVPIIGLTAFAPPGFYERCLRAGMDACFEKPFRAALMQQIIQRWLSGPSRAHAAGSGPIAALNASGDRPPRRGASPQGLAGRGRA